MRVAVLSDIHGNLPALEAVLAEVERLSVDRIVLNGDIAAGPLPGDTIDRLVGLGGRAVWVHGNGERVMVAGYDSAGAGADVPGAAEDRGAGRLLTKAQRDRLAGLPLSVTLEVDGLGPVLFCHATPRRDDEIVLVDSAPGRWDTVLAGLTVETVVLGHTHMPFARLAGGRQAVNPGSVGMPYGHAGAAWALLGPGLELRRTAYDVEAAAARLRRSELPWAEDWVKAYVLHHYTGDEALAAFTRMADTSPT
jgi:predicted phosphodiesterase